MKRLQRFLRQYKEFSFAVIALLVGLGLWFSDMHTAAKWVIDVVALLEAVPLLVGMYKDVRSGTYGIDILAVTAIVASVWLGQPWAAIVIVLMLTGGESLEDYAEHRAKSELSALLARAPRKAVVLRKGKEVSVKVSEVHVGDKVILKAGDLVPVDAVILEGSANFDESSLTGESLPQSKNADDQLLSGSIILDGAVTAKAIATAEHSQYQTIVKLVRNAANSQAPFVRLADRYSIPFTLISYAIAGSVWALTGDAIRFLEVIVVATPCPLLLAAPIALISGMGRASRHGVIVKTGGSLERLAEAKTIAFDKTGTLTRGALAVDAVKAYGKFSRNDVLSLAAALEQNSNHVLAQAILTTAQADNVKVAKVKQFKEIAGRGMQASVKGQAVLVGSAGLLADHNVELPKKFDSPKQTAVYVAVDDALAGVITLSDEIRPEAAHTLKMLHKFGIRNIMMITGDNKTTAQTIAKELSIDTVHAEMLPGDKLRTIETTKGRPLVFVGDGVNDAPALTAADVGVALGARGSAAASESADMVIMSDDVDKVAVALAIARRTFKIAKQSILLGIGMSVGLMLIFATGKFPPLAGALIQELVDVVVIFNALRAHVGKLSLD